VELIDEDGRLFGVVNVIDALAVLLVLAVVVAGIALVNPFAPSGEETTRYATVDLDEQPAYVADLISEGDVMSPSNTPRNLTITDVYVTPTPGENVSITVRARINGTLKDREGQPGQVFTYGNTRIRQGGSFTLDTADYTVDGTVTRLDADGRALETERTEAILTTKVSPGVARTIEAGQTVTVADREVARITQVHVGPGNESTIRQVYLGVELETLRRSRGQSFGGGLLAPDRSIPFQTNVSSLTARVRMIGSSDLKRESIQAVIETTIQSRVADEISVGDEYRLAGTTVATLRSIDTYPDGGEAQTHVFVGVELTTVRLDGKQVFGAKPLQLGATIPFETDAYRLSGTVIGRGSLTPPGETTTKTVVVKVANIPPEIADGIRTGMTEESPGQTTARLVDKRTEPADVILTSESGEIFQRQHPRNQDVYLTVEVTVRSTRTGLRFHSRTIQEGDIITLDFGTISVNGTVIEIR
jgi:hypothetical protein